MHLYRGLYNLPDQKRDSVLTIGNFDGVHKGHQAILEQVESIARQRDRASIVLIFEPQPLEFFKSDNAPVRLTRLREKLILIRQWNIDSVVCLHFNRELASMSAESFANDILLKRLRARSIIIGEDFRFGQGRSAGLDELRQFAAQSQCEVHAAATYELNNKRISSSWVREALSVPDLGLVRQLLGRDYSLCGRVIPGDQRGRELGFPTANVSLQRHVAPIRGVFASLVKIGNEPPVQAVTNIGQRPVFGGGPVLMETHLLDTNRDCYGELIEVVLQKHLRDEKKFDSIAALKAQIARDIDAARDYFK